MIINKSGEDNQYINTGFNIDKADEILEFDGINSYSRCSNERDNVGTFSSSQNDFTVEAVHTIPDSQKDYLKEPHGLDGQIS